MDLQNFYIKTNFVYVGANKVWASKCLWSLGKFGVPKNLESEKVLGPKKWGYKIPTTVDKCMVYIENTPS